MDCFSCEDGKLLNSEIIFAQEYDGRTLVIKKIPGLKCDYCGAEYFNPKENENIRKIVSLFLKDSNQDTDVIFDYRKMVDILS